MRSHLPINPEKGFANWRTLSGFDRFAFAIPGLSLRSNPGLKLANAFGVFIEPVVNYLTGREEENGESARLIQITSIYKLGQKGNPPMRVPELCRHICLLVVIVIFSMSTLQAQEKRTPPLKSGFITTPDNVKIHYLEAGRQNRSSLLFVPGWMTPAWIWEHQITHFAKNYRVVAMDPRSQGKSSKAFDGHHPAARARDIKALVDKLELSPVVIVANSITVTEAVSYVDQFGTDSLAGLVLVNGIAGRDYDKETTWGLLSYANGFQTDRRRAAERFVRGLYKKKHSEEYLSKMIDATLQMPTNSAVAVFLGSLMSDNRSVLPKIDRPTLIVVARVPAWMPLYEDLQKGIRNARLEVFEDAGHALFVDEAPKFNMLLEDFLKSITR